MTFKNDHQSNKNRSSNENNNILPDLDLLQQDVKLITLPKNTLSQNIYTIMNLEKLNTALHKARLLVRIGFPGFPAHTSKTRRMDKPQKYMKINAYAKAYLSTFL